MKANISIEIDGIHPHHLQINEADSEGMIYAIGFLMAVMIKTEGLTVKKISKIISKVMPIISKGVPSANAGN